MRGRDGWSWGGGHERIGLCVVVGQDGYEIWYEWFGFLSIKND